MRGRIGSGRVSSGRVSSGRGSLGLWDLGFPDEEVMFAEGGLDLGTAPSCAGAGLGSVLMIAIKSSDSTGTIMLVSISQRPSGRSFFTSSTL